MNRGLSAFNIHMHRDLENYEIDFDVYLPSIGRNLQRGFVWMLEQKQELILSVLKGIKLPPMAFVHYDHKVFQVIDGKQRIKSMLDFYDGLFGIPFNGKEYYFYDLDKDAQNEIKHLFFVADVAYEYPHTPISDNNKIAWFNLINFAGTPADKKHMIELTTAAGIE